MSYQPISEYPPTRPDLGRNWPQPQPEPQPSRRPAPGSVHATVIIMYLVGLVAIGSGALAIWIALRGTGLVGSAGDLPVDVAEVGLPTGAVAIFAGLFMMAIARKVQRGRQWARMFVLVLSVVSAAWTLYAGTVGPGQGNVLAGLVLPVVYLILLNTRAARSWFRDRTY
jgi:hypothetical protein